MFLPIFTYLHQNLLNLLIFKWFRKEIQTTNLELNKNLSVDIDGSLFYKIDKQTNASKLQFVNNDSYMILNSLDFNDNGNYLCLANNSYGYSYRLAHLNVLSSKLKFFPGPC